QYTVRPFSEPELAAVAARSREKKQLYRRWNRHLSKLRIKIEHAFGMLKGRFPILRDIPATDLDNLYENIEALMVIHNILRVQGDDPSDIDGYNGEEEDEIVNDRE
ncbi:hypothetical protein SISNIDRAFT_383258, partial [Sistotremastrum niveocremeum HHB9708]